jgi:hypothetical protein
VLARGFDPDTSTTRLNYWINRAYHRICEREAWPFLETTTTGTAPLSITDLRAVLSVVDSTNESTLTYEDFRTIREDDPTLATSGTPYCWYQSAATTIAVYPTQAVSLSVRYLKFPTDLSSGADTPVIPTRYQYLIVEGAVGYAYRDTDNYEAAQAVEEVFDRGVLEMGDTLLVPNYDSLRSLVSYDASTDW